uniref:Tektin n=1 Tax=Salmo trutta TaxID=8032 RepID=A0A674D0D5_SALTR
MATTSRKPGQRYRMTDWETNNKLLTDTAEHQRHQSQQTRQERRALRHQTACKVQRLRDRDCYGCLMPGSRRCIDRDDRLMFTSIPHNNKEEAERTLTDTSVPLEVVVDELVSDPQRGQLKREAQIIDTTQQELQQHISKAFEQLCCLKEAHQQLTFDLTNKSEALVVNQSCLSLTDRSPDISFKPDPTHIPTSASTHQESVQFTHYNMTQAEEAMQASLQESVNIKIVLTSIESKVDNSRRPFLAAGGFSGLLSADSVLFWLCLSHQTREEITDLLRGIHCLEQELLPTECPLKLVHTRLENRNSRPGVDLCRDQTTCNLHIRLLHLRDRLRPATRTAEQIEEYFCLIKKK